MRDSGAPSIGDLVVALYDEERDISCVGLVMQVQSFDCKVQWLSESNPPKKFNALNIHLTT